MPYLTDCSEDFLLMRVHLCKSTNLGQVDILSVAKGNNFIKGKDQIKAVFGNLILLQGSAIFRDLVESRNKTPSQEGSKRTKVSQVLQQSTGQRRASVGSHWFGNFCS